MNIFIKIESRLGRKEVVEDMQKAFDVVKIPGYLFIASNIELQRDGITYVGMMTYRKSA